MVFGYIRVSTEQQSLQNQKHKILEYAQLHKLPFLTPPKHF